MPMTSKEMCKLLKKNGFIEIKGGPTGHRKFFNPVSKRTTVVNIANLKVTKNADYKFTKIGKFKITFKVTFLF